MITSTIRVQALFLLVSSVLGQRTRIWKRSAAEMENENKKRGKPGFFGSLRWSIGEVAGQLLVVPAVVIAAYFGLTYESWLLFFALVVPLVVGVVFLSKAISGKNPFR
ncbi:hypothetical protein [Marinimicrobium agarilyticum]|uniref:hypothetical protein n=1 Tax=Marinimicrobium agarilyticum TaxID=306546 RepID=UPI0012F6FB45|nr:hypothetical protein [Marinimicrobium agarilyticum]